MTVAQWRICVAFPWRIFSSWRHLEDTNCGQELMAEGKIKIKLVRSPISAPEKHKKIVRGLGLRKLNQVAERPDTAAFRGMVAKIPHLLAVIE